MPTSLALRAIDFKHERVAGLAAAPAQLVRIAARCYLAVMTSYDSIGDLITEGARQFGAAKLCIGHNEDNAIDEARILVLHALHLPPELPAHFAKAQVTPEEAQAVRAVLKRRIVERVPAAYLTGRAQFAGLTFRTDARALVPRSPIAELIEAGFEPYLAGRTVKHALDLCCGGGSIAVAIAVHQPSWQVDALDVSEAALSLTRENVALHRVEKRVRVLQSDLFAAVPDQRYQLIVSNPPYLTSAQFRALPAEYAHEPELALVSGSDGLDLPLRLLKDACAHLSSDGLLILEVGEAEVALRDLLPKLAMQWLEFSVGSMGVCAIEARDLRAQRAQLSALCEARSGSN